MVTDYYEMWKWADADRHRLIGAEWVATKRAIRAEAEVKELKKKILDMQRQPELLFPSIKHKG
ncbi:hypothetical protein Xoosp13_77 [Xanthomonas phage Xoo-sp13]|nr:hypothetical protein Xoosp13_77 [Xanthomonas phage Xoo-sp13]